MTPRPPVVLLRQSLAAPAELVAAARAGFTVLASRAHLAYAERGARVIPRYSVLPEPEEFYADLAHLAAVPANDLRAHQYLADALAWSGDFPDDTPRTWEYRSLARGDLPGLGPWVVKGRTNSRKGSWSRRMYAATPADVGRAALSLLDDAELARQGLVVREHVALAVLRARTRDVADLPPVADEWRFFGWGRDVLASGFYWHEDVEQSPPTPPGAEEFIRDAVAPVVAERARFWVADVARRAAGGWVLVELNDGQQSGPQGVPPDVLYRGLAAARW